jgi:hypothetical protein
LAPIVGIAATGFCYPGGILQAFIDKIRKLFIDKISKFFIDKINKFCGCRQQSDPDRFSSDHRRPFTSTISEYIAILFLSGEKSAVSNNSWQIDGINSRRVNVYRNRPYSHQNRRARKASRHFQQEKLIRSSSSPEKTRRVVWFMFLREYQS